MPDERKYLPTSESCFVCGEENPAGLKGRFFVEDGVVKMPLHVAPHHCGYPGTVHGGVVAGAMDECMGWAAARSIQRMCLTGELTVRYLQRVPSEQDLTVVAQVVRSHPRMVHAQAELVGEDGIVYARSEGRFLPLSAEQTLEVDEALLYRGGEERVFSKLHEEAERVQ